MEYELYSGTVRLDFTESSHRYKVSILEGEEWTKPKAVTGVSTILNTLNKPALMLWPLNLAITHLKNLCPNITLDDILEASKLHTKRSGSGKDTGTDIHSGIESALSGTDWASDNEEAVKAVEAFQKWYAKQEATPVEIEMVMYSKKHDFAGTCDAVLELGNRRVLVDWKSTNASRDAPHGIYAENFLQMGAYALMYQEQTATKLDDLMIGNASKQGKFSTLTASQLGLTVDQCINAFESLLNVYRFHTRNSNFIKARSK